MKRYLLMIILSVFSLQSASAEPVSVNRPSPERYCYDYAEVLSADTVREIENQARGIQRSFDIDFVVVTIPSLDWKDIRECAVNLFSGWEIGKSTQGKKGILILIAPKEQKIKIEIGYDLEGIYTDAYVGQVERDILKEFLEQAEWGTGFYATIESFLFRIFNHDWQDEVKNISSPDDPLGYYSQGAGAHNTFDFGAALNKPLPDNYDQTREYFSAQPTPELAFERYMELCAKGVKHNNDLMLFTELSNEFWKGWKHTSGQQKAEAQELSGRGYFIRQNDTRAVVFFPDGDNFAQKKLHLYFLAGSKRGWQVDINTMTRTMRCVGPGWWAMTDSLHAYTEIVMQYYNKGDNGFFVKWDSSKAFCPLYRKSERPGDKGKPGICIGVWHHYEGALSLMDYDRVLAVNGVKVRDGWHFDSLLEDALVGQPYRFTILRDDRQMEIEESFGPHKDGYERYRKCLKTPRRWMGVYLVQTLDSEWEHTRALRNQGKFPYTSLCYVLEVYPGSPADKAGLRQGDFIIDYGVPDANGEIMPYDVVDHFYSSAPGEDITLTVLRDMKDVVKVTIIPEETMHKGYF
ncbi:MAG: TPM domain-containing protein [Candidatus Omnitrophota bacterium]